ncbi:MAG: DJ-1/PfpI family protein [Elusimicrobiota bacterium]
MKKPLVLLFCILSISFLVAATKKETSKKEMPKKMLRSPWRPESAFGGGKVVMIIAKNEFRDEEYLQPKEILTKSKVEVVTVSSSTGTAKGMLGAIVNVDITINEVDAKNYDAVIFIGGGGASEYFDNKQAHKIAVDTINNKKILAAICIAPVTLAKAGVLKGKKATVFPSGLGIDEIKKYGGTYTGKKVEVDGNIVTAYGPEAAKQFGEKILELLNTNGGEK